VARLRELGHAPEFAVLMNGVAARGWTEVHSGEKGRGLQAAKAIPAGTLVALFAGKHLDRDGDLSTEEYSYSASRILGDPACLPPAVNGSLVNDAVSTGVLARLREKGPEGFALAYYQTTLQCTVELRWLAPGLAALRTVRDLAPGEALEYHYGFEYWVQLVAAGALGVSWEVAWGACHELTRGDPARDRRVLEFFGLGGLSANRRAAALATLGLSPRLPSFFERLGIRVYFSKLRPTGADLVLRDAAGNVKARAWNSRASDQLGDAPVESVFLTRPGIAPTPADKRAPFTAAGENIHKLAEHLAQVCPPPTAAARRAAVAREMDELTEAARASKALRELHELRRVSSAGGD
jgi:hypothetical protein